MHKDRHITAHFCVLSRI